MTSSGRQLHQPVMLRQSMELLGVRPGGIFVDATSGAGGHLKEICRLVGDEGTVFGIDRDLQSLERLRQEVGSRTKLLHANYCDIIDVLEEEGVSTVNGGILADLGVSSMQLDDSSRGFSFQHEGPLDMR